jgi:hypothetical protein
MKTRWAIVSAAIRPTRQSSAVSRIYIVEGLATP